MIHLFHEFNTLDDYTNYVKNLNYSILSCPTCPAIGNFKIHGYYKRNIVFINEGNIRQERIKVQVVKCKSCKHTHALLPSFIIPYHIYSVKFIMNCLDEKFNQQTVESICGKYNTSHQLLYSWVHRFDEHSVLTKALFNQGLLSFKQLINRILSFEQVFDYLGMYFSQYRLFFMQFISPG